MIFKTKVFYLIYIYINKENSYKNKYNRKKKKISVILEELYAHDGLYNLCLKTIFGINDIKVTQMAVSDFIHGYGTYHDLCDRAGLNVEQIKKNCKKLLNS